LIAILDSDDMWSPTFLATQMAVFDAHPGVDVVTGNAWFLGGRFDGRPARPWPDTRPDPNLLTIIGDEMSMFIMSVFRRRVYDTVGGFDETMRCNEDYDFWLRAAAAGFRFTRNDQPLGYYRRRDDSLSADELKMLRGILRVYYKLRQSIAHRPDATAIVDAQIDRFETERLAAEVRAAIETRDFPALSDFLTALHERRGGAMLRLARVLAKWSPGLLSKAYELRRVRQAVQ
jgi:GT2 family glycosyltransferase